MARVGLAPLAFLRMPKLKIKALLVTQFFGVFNDNAWKLMVAFLGIRFAAEGFRGTELELEVLAQTQTGIAFSALTIPLILFSIPAAILADRISKQKLIVGLKLFELLAMVAATFVLIFLPTNFMAMLVVLGLMGVQSAFFSPAKFGLLPEIVSHEQLTKANSQLELWAFVAIILGTATGGLILESFEEQLYWSGVVLISFSAVGVVSSFWIPKVPAANSDAKPFETLAAAMAAIRSDRVLWLSVVGAIIFWAVASLLGQNVLVHSKQVLELSEKISGIPLAIYGVGVGVGSLLASRLSGPKVEYGLIPLGAIGLSFFGLLMGLLPALLWLLCVLMFFMGISSAFIIVPVQALIQWRAPEQIKGAVIGLSNVFIFSGIFLGTLLAFAFAYQNLNTSAIFVGAALITFIATLWGIKLLPDSLIRLVLIVLTHTFYKLRVIGRQHIPEQGGTLLVPNHVSFVDALFLLATVDRPIRFIVHSGYYHHWLFRPFMKAFKAIPVSSEGGPKEIMRALKNAGEYLDQGEVVCIFPEGQLSRTGTMLPFRRGLERIVKDRDARIVPVHLDRVWGSIFSRERGRFLTKLPKELRYRITVSYHSPLPSESSIYEIRKAIQAAGTAAWMARKEISQPLHYSFIQMAKRHPTRMLFADQMTDKVTTGKALVASVALARELHEHWGGQKKVGILLPPSVGGALTNLAATISGRTVVNLNYTVGPSSLRSAIKQANLESIVTARKFLEMAGIEDLPADVELIYIEDVKARLNALKRLMAAIVASLPFSSWIERLCGATRKTSVDDTAAIIFSSGSTGEPKGVMLSHFNIDSNIDALAQVMRPEKYDRFLGVLPFFHSFGNVVLWFCCKKALGLPMHPNPLDVSAVGRLIQKFRVTILLATPTFLQLYMRRCSPAQFGSIRFCWTGAEKLTQRLALAFEDNFGIRPRDAYGATECSPGIAASVPDFRAAGFFQPGAKMGYVGQALPGVSVKIVDPETKVELGPNEPGMLLVRGPNVMQGYLNKPELTAEVLQDGWYNTGDIALIDEDGFIKITDRLARFSKIGGEMVPHGVVEDAIHEAAGLEVKTFAVTSIEDETKGEVLAVVHTYQEEKIQEVVASLGQTGLPNLFIPRKDKFVRVEELPILGTGKLDLQKLKEIASKKLGS